MTSGLDYIKLRDAENPVKNLPLYDTMRKFAKRDIVKYFGLSIDAFLAQPRDVCEEQFRIALEMQKELADKIPKTDPPKTS